MTLLDSLLAALCLSPLSVQLLSTLSPSNMSCSLQPQGLCSFCLPLVKTDCHWGHNYKSLLSGGLPWSPLLWDSHTTLCVPFMLFLTPTCRLFTHIEPPPSPKTENSVRWGAMSVLISALSLAHNTYLSKQVSPSFSKSNKYVNLADCWLFSKIAEIWEPKAASIFEYHIVKKGLSLQSVGQEKVWDQ